MSVGVLRFKCCVDEIRKYSEHCATGSEEIKPLMMKIYAEAKDASLGKRKFNIIEDKKKKVK